jgi:thiol-disulfide isomerase/thioredoxin
MIKYFLLFSFLSLGVNAQVKLLTLNELEQRMAKGSDTTYVVNFWATWCGPCVEELPSFEKLQKDNLNKPLKVILLILDFKSKLSTAVIPFVEKNRLKTEVYVINEKDQQKFIERVDQQWEGAIPATLFYNKEKKIRHFYEKPFKTYEDLVDKIISLDLKV